MLTIAVELQHHDRKCSGSKHFSRFRLIFKLTPLPTVQHWGRGRRRSITVNRPDAFVKRSSPTWPSASSLQDNRTFFISPFHNASDVTQLEKDYLLFTHVLASFFFFFIVTATADQTLDRNLTLLSGHVQRSLNAKKKKKNRRKCPVVSFGLLHEPENAQCCWNMQLWITVGRHKGPYQQ